MATIYVPLTQENVCYISLDHYIELIKAQRELEELLKSIKEKGEKK